MKKRLLKHFTLFSFNLETAEYLENFLISAVLAVLSIRVFLKLSGYPQLSRGQIHIAHMLWGGLLMMIALILTLVFLNKEAKHLAAIIGGLGFGTFIDELGKFITKDNNYFFQPTIAFLYILFVLLFFSFRLLIYKIRVTKKDYAINALELLKEVVFYDLDLQEKEKALSYLKKGDRRNQIVKGLETILLSIKAKDGNNIHPVTRAKQYFRRKYLEIVRKKWFANVITGFFIVVSIANIFRAINNARLENLSFWDWGGVVSAIMTGMLSLIGIYCLRRNQRMSAYEKFKQAVLVSIFLSQFFAFYKEQLSALLSLLFSISIYAALKHLIEQEELLIEGRVLDKFD